ncbi:MAG: response regulator, partial [Syntrophales bacterium]|nr:response regulator [Syntrophales bacterium]
QVFESEGADKAITTILTNLSDANRINIAIIDFQMPGMDGLETLIAIGQLNPEITRIMLTGYATMESAIEAVNAGIDGFLTKPFDNLELRAKVREYNIKKRLKQFVAEPVLRELQREGAAIQPKRVEASVLFCDIRNFSGIAEGMNPQELTELLNRSYFSPLDRIIYDSRGTLDKHIGDGIMGIFGAPRPEEDDALRAVRCALRMRDEMDRINTRLFHHGWRLDIGIGIGTGEVMAGIFGSALKKEYTAFGHTVNLASRLEHLAEAGQILVCGRTFEKVKDHVVAEEMVSQSIKGVEGRVPVYRILGEK